MSKETTEQIDLLSEKEIQNIVLVVSRRNTNGKCPSNAEYYQSICQAQIDKCKANIRQQIIEEIEKHSKVLLEDTLTFGRIDITHREMDESWWQQFKRR